MLQVGDIRPNNVILHRGNMHVRSIQILDKQYILGIYILGI